MKINATHIKLEESGRCFFEYWRFYLQKDVQSLEKLQRLVIRTINGMEILFYLDRLFTLNLFSLEWRRLRCNLIECFKFFNGIVCFYMVKGLKLWGETSLQIHSLTLKKQRVRTRLRGHSSTQIVLNCWKVLPKYVVNPSRVMLFKRNLLIVLASVISSIQHQIVSRYTRHLLIDVRNKWHKLSLSLGNQSYWLDANHLCYFWASLFRHIVSVC